MPAKLELPPPALQQAGLAYRAPIGSSDTGHPSSATATAAVMLLRPVGPARPYLRSHAGLPIPKPAARRIVNSPLVQCCAQQRLGCLQRAGQAAATVVLTSVLLVGGALPGNWRRAEPRDIAAASGGRLRIYCWEHQGNP